MRPLWIAIDSRPDETRVLATAGPRETVLKARLSPTPQHPRAVLALLEAPAAAGDVRGGAMTDVAQRARIRLLVHAGHCKFSSELDVHRDVVPDGE